jgi:hypothetical protein
MFPCLLSRSAILSIWDSMVARTVAEGVQTPSTLGASLEHSCFSCFAADSGRSTARESCAREATGGKSMKEARNDANVRAICLRKFMGKVSHLSGAGSRQVPFSATSLESDTLPKTFMVGGVEWSAVVCFRKRYPTLSAMRLRIGWGTRFGGGLVVRLRRFWRWWLCRSGR